MYLVSCTLSVVVATGNANVFVLIFNDYYSDPKSILDAFAFPGATVKTPRKGMSDRTCCYTKDLVYDPPNLWSCTTPREHVCMRKPMPGWPYWD